MPLTPGTILGHYEITAPLGKGGMGEVYRATDQKLKREVALKVLPPSLANTPDRLARFQREAEVLASLNHPNIAQIFGIEEADGIRAIAMELVEGETLADIIKRGPIPVDTAIAYCKQIAGALEYAHDKTKPVIHRDLKPANVQVTPEGIVKVLDFGLAKALADEPAAPSADPGNSPTLTMGPTVVGMILGTASYMSPEQAKGKPLDRRTDIWSFGAMLFEMVTATRPFVGEEIGDILAAVINQEPKYDAVPARLRPAIERCLRKEPRKRWYSMEDVRFALEEPAPVESPLFDGHGSVKHARFGVGWIAAAAVFALIAAGVSFLHFRETPPVEHALRYTVAPPENGSVHSFAISPDGTLMVMAAAVNGKRQLWLRPLDALQWQPMPSTDDARYPFWSPDSRNIAFFADGKLRRIAAAGGPSQPICDATDGRGGSWNRDDIIVFGPTGGTATPIQRVPAAGGVSVAVTKPGVRNLYPTFLPDGQRFLYATTGMTEEQNGIYLASLDSKDTRRILPDASGFAFATPTSSNRNGQILFLREDNLMAQPFDPSRLEISGDVFPVAERIFLSNGNNYAPVTVSSNSLLLYWSGASGGDGGSQMVWYDRTGKSPEPVGPSSSVAPAISPDGKTIAFSKAAVSRGGANPRDIWLRDLERGNERRLTTDISNNIAPFWSKTGDRLVFRSNRGTPNDLYVRASSGSGQDELSLSTPNPKSPTQWSADGRFIVYSEGDPKTKSDISVLPMDQAGQKPTPFLHSVFNEWHGQLSPDSHWMAYTSDVSGAREVYVQPFPVPDNEIRISLAGGEQPRWRADGKELYYLAADGKMTAVPITLPAGAKPTLKAGAPVALFDAHSSAVNQVYFNYDVTPDGKRFLVSTSGGTQATTASTPPLTVRLNWQPARN